MKQHILAPVFEDESDYDAIEREILKILLDEIYKPILAELGESVAVIKNSGSALEEAIGSGRVTFYRGSFTGKFGAKISRELAELGAKWKDGQWKITIDRLPPHITSAISRSESKFIGVLSRIDKKLEALFPAKIAGKVSLEKLFDRTLWKVDAKIQKQLKAITVAPQLTKEESAKIAGKYSENLQLYIQDFTEKQIYKLRDKVKENTFAGVRYEALMKDIQKSYGVSKSKARFLARQETSLMMSEFKQSRYESAGSSEYIWRCVHGTPAHPVRPMHKRLDGTRQKWTSPPVTSEDGSRNHPGQDYGCRCSARAIIKF